MSDRTWQQERADVLAHLEQWREHFTAPAGIPTSTDLKLCWLIAAGALRTIIDEISRGKHVTAPKETR